MPSAPVRREKIDPTMRVLMWLCAEKRVQRGISQDDLGKRISAINPDVDVLGATLSRFERGERWLNASRPVLRAYAQLGGLVSPAFLWLEATRLTIWFGSDTPAMLEGPAEGVSKAIEHLNELRELDREHGELMML